MKYPTSEKLEIVRLVKQSHQPVKTTLAQLGISKATFYRWYERCQAFGTAAYVTDMLEDALSASGCDAATVIRKPRLLSDNGWSYISGNLADWLGDHGMGHVRGAPNRPQIRLWAAIGPRPMADGQDRALTSDAEEPHPAGELLSARRPGTGPRHLHRPLQSRPMP